MKRLYRHWLLVTAVLVCLGACSSSASDSGRDESADAATPTTAGTSSTTTLGPMPPELRLPEVARADIGQTFSDAIVASDPNGDPVTVEIRGRSPEGFSTVVNARGLITALQWQPTRAGEWDVDVAAIDAGGLETEATIHLVARNVRADGVVLAMGDSVAAGFGRDRSDFAGNDECFRSEGDAYGAAVTEALVAAGHMPDDAEVRFVACAGATAQTLRNVSVPVTNGRGEGAGPADSQLDTAIALNPALITMTIGSSDLALFRAEVLTKPGANDDPAVAIDAFLTQQRLDTFETNLRLALETLVRTTDAHIVLTTWYDPTAAAPIGVDGCRQQCMVEVMAKVTSDANDVIVSIVNDLPGERVTLARLDGEADVWEAKNGIGPDALREGLGPLQGLVDSFTGGSSASCADTGAPAVDLVSTLDCAHPNEDGHLAIAEVVIEAVLTR